MASISKTFMNGLHLAPFSKKDVTSTLNRNKARSSENSGDLWWEFLQTTLIRTTSGRYSLPSPVSSMLPVPRQQKASQECVGESPKANTLAGDRPEKDGSIPPVDGRPDGLSTEGTRAPIKVIDGRLWSPGVYCALRLLGKSLEVAWERAFVWPSHF